MPKLKYLLDKIQIDSDDLEKFKDYYFSIDPRNYIRGTKGSLHRLIMNVKKTFTYVDHINRNTLDNRKQNLRIVNCSQNIMNTGLSKRNELGIKGVSIEKNKYRKSKPYRARITVDGKLKHLGYFKTPEEAKIARQKAIKQYFKEYACE